MLNHRNTQHTRYTIHIRCEWWNSGVGCICNTHQLQMKIDVCHQKQHFIRLAMPLSSFLLMYIELAKWKKLMVTACIRNVKSKEWRSKRQKPPKHTIFNTVEAGSFISSVSWILSSHCHSAISGGVQKYRRIADLCYVWTILNNVSMDFSAYIHVFFFIPSGRWRCFL